MKRYYYIIVPSCLLVLVHALILLVPGFAESFASASSYFSICGTLYLVTILLGIRFGQEKYVFFAILFFSVFSILHLYYFIELNTAAGNGALFFASLLIPFNLVLFSLLPARRIGSYDGLFRILTVLIQAASLFVFHGANSQWAEKLLSRTFFLSAMPDWLAIPELGLYAGLVVAGGMIIVWIKKDRPDLQMIAALQICLLFALNFNSTLYTELAREGVLVVMAGLTAIVLLFNILESSLGTVKLDALTGLPGRKALEERLSTLAGLYTIAMVDIDHFKVINDKYGHETGDQVLRFLSARLKDLPFGEAYRYGGEEFTIVAAGWDKKELQPLLDELRQAIDSAEFYLRSSQRPKRRQKGHGMRKSASTGKKIKLSVSIGVAHVSKSYPKPDMVIIAADKALYKAKENGRNRTEVSLR